MMLDPNTICFVSCVNNVDYYKNMLSYVRKLHIPKGMDVEFLPIINAQSMCSGYNSALLQNNAKFKVYMHQDVYILNKNFIRDILCIFSDTNIGLIGMIGAKTLPSSLVWWKSDNIFGKVIDSHTGEKSLLSFGYSEKMYEKVFVVDGLLMVTQHDIKWRDDIFKNWHFYDISQSIEFQKAGYSVVVVNSHDVWVEHDCGVASIIGYEEAKEAFLNEYASILGSARDAEEDTR